MRVQILVPLKAVEEFLSDTTSWEKRKKKKCSEQGEISTSWEESFLYMITLISVILLKVAPQIYNNVNTGENCKRVFSA